MLKDISIGALMLILGLIALTIIGTWALFFNRPAAKYAEETRRQVYDESRSYRQGMAVDLDELCRQRKLATDEGQKAILADTIRLRSARFTGELPSHVKDCLNEVR